ncbi:conserved hypothetical protein [Bosea sp. 62]|nr:conserved hypothetical protein [Bosea sp. 46]CAD5264581.1 conserved hypothetical protein [Bosea sp. 21B]CAD5275739.1 conserved hypothetical protein [Bosea sp. 7B]VVT59121.1 conserved hypothetical protein [Bosea sp. EC-HK365B]VXB70252.1 conserved hypothetical protein [Bosea sp. 29B]VXC10009.1 conserved hypothetical protein [Bosea sp. 125]VXC31495.1 conserved hypothetical protein [Bosea sp. 62]VXC76170.1 conserved hypothetical protein [Bosea sp. 127]
METGSASGLQPGPGSGPAASEPGLAKPAAPARPCRRAENDASKPPIASCPRRCLAFAGGEGRFATVSAAVLRDAAAIAELGPHQRIGAVHRPANARPTLVAARLRGGLDAAGQDAGRLAIEHDARLLDLTRLLPLWTRGGNRRQQRLLRGRQFGHAAGIHPRRHRLLALLALLRELGLLGFERGELLLLLGQFLGEALALIRIGRLRRRHLARLRHGALGVGGLAGIAASKIGRRLDAVLLGLLHAVQQGLLLRGEFLLELLALSRRKATALDQIEPRLGVDGEEAGREALDEGLDLGNVVAAAQALPDVGVGLLAIEVEIAEQREREFRRLLATGGIVDRLLDAAEHSGDLEAGLLDLLHQRRRERAVAAGTVGGDVVGLRRIGGHHALRLHDRCEAGADRHAARRRLLRELGEERIVAASVEHHDLDALGEAQRRGDFAQLDSLVLDRDLVIDLGFDRDQEVLAVELEAVAGIVEHHRVGILREAGEARDSCVHAPLVEIDAIDHLETDLAQRLGGVARIVRRVGQSGSVLVGGIADHQGDAAFLRLCQRRHDDELRKKSDQCTKSDGYDHGTIPCVTLKKVTVKIQIYPPVMTGGLLAPHPTRC